MSVSVEVWEDDDVQFYNLNSEEDEMRSRTTILTITLALAFGASNAGATIFIESTDAGETIGSAVSLGALPPGI